jgi:SAM-dependent methyltransferase
MTTMNNNAVNQPKAHEIEVRKPGFFGKIKWAVVKAGFSTFGRSSKGVRTGYRFGFDSGNMLDYVYVNKAHGTLLVGKLVDRFYLNSIGWRGIRARRVLLKQMLKAEIENNRADGIKTRILDVAAGPGRYLQELLQEIGEEKGDVEVLCRDLSLAGVTQGAQQAQEAGIKHIQYEQGDAFNPAPTNATLGSAPNVIVVSGLYELMLEDEIIRTSLKTLYKFLTPGGAIFYTAQNRHPQLEFIANVLPNRDGIPWVMRCRPVEAMDNWGKEAGFKQVESRIEEVGLFSVTTGRK